MNRSLKILTVVGARPQFIKAAPVTRVLQSRGHHHLLIHTGQHYDSNMSQVFFEELDIPVPHRNLEVGSGTHGWQTAHMLMGLERIFLQEEPDWVLVYGDTNSTLAAALAAVKLHVPVAHVEAGLRSFNREMPEEHNRVLTDHCADVLFCPTETAVKNLAAEGIRQGVYWVGDTMFDALLAFLQKARAQSTILRDLDLIPQRYLLATVHRPYNTDSPETLQGILEAFCALQEPVIFPVHPRTRVRLDAMGVEPGTLAACGVRMIEPVGYLDMLLLEEHARMILTDSGGMQKEAYLLRTPCVTLRPETEWVETVEAGWNQVVGSDPAAIIRAVREFHVEGDPPPLFGDGRAAEKIVDVLEAAVG